MILKEEDFLTFKVEVMTLSALEDHPNIVKFYGGCFDLVNVCVIMECIFYL